MLLRTASAHHVRHAHDWSRSHLHSGCQSRRVIHVETGDNDKKDTQGVDGGEGVDNSEEATLESGGVESSYIQTGMFGAVALMNRVISKQECLVLLLELDLVKCSDRIRRHHSH
jgi:hypothetical protein